MYEYRIETGRAIITRWCGEESHIAVPERIDGCAVEEIDYLAFSRCTASSISLPEGLLVIGGRAFSGCVWLRRLVIPRSVRVIGAYAFSLCETEIYAPHPPEYYGYTNMDPDIEWHVCGDGRA